MYCIHVSVPFYFHAYTHKQLHTERNWEQREELHPVSLKGSQQTHPDNLRICQYNCQRILLRAVGRLVALLTAELLDDARVQPTSIYIQ